VLIVDFPPADLALRLFLSTAISEVPEFSDYLAQAISGLLVAYPAKAADAHPLVGRRVPGLRFSEGTGLFALLRRGHRVLLNLSGGAAEVARACGEAEMDVVMHADALAEDRADWNDVRAALIRPDGHVSWAATEPADEALAKAATSALAAIGA
jgi:hypothetical protein